MTIQESQINVLNISLTMVLGTCISLSGTEPKIKVYIYSKEKAKPYLKKRLSKLKNQQWIDQSIKVMESLPNLKWKVFT